MSNPSYFQDNPDAWGHSTFNGTGQTMKAYDGERDKYFTKGKDGHYVLKDGYEQREQSNDSTSMGAVATYSNESSDYDGEDNTFKHYGIYKKHQSSPQQQAPASAVETPKAATPEKKPKGPVEYSPEITQAKERVNKFSSMIDGNMGSTYTGANDASKSNEATQSFLDSKKTDLKKSYNFKPATNTAYGAN